VDAKLTHVRARRMVLDDKGSRGYAVLLSAKVAEGDFSSWRTADPRERGNFLHHPVDEKSEMWVYDLGHTAAKTGVRFGYRIRVRFAFSASDMDLSSLLTRFPEAGWPHYRWLWRSPTSSQWRRLSAAGFCARASFCSSWESPGLRLSSVGLFRARIGLPPNASSGS
jgi:hypothetical protein